MSAHAPGQGQARVAVVGCGYWGRNLVRNFHALGALAAVADATPGGRALAAQLAPGARLEIDIAPLLADEALDAIVLASPAPTHAALGIQVLEAGKDLFVEKPMVLSMKEGRLLQDAARRSGRLVQVGHLLEYHPAFQSLRTGLASGRLGPLRLLESRRCNFGKVRTEEDSLWSLAPHDVAMVLRLAGGAPEKLSCHGLHVLGTTRADAATAVLTFPSGLNALITCSWCHPVKEQRLTVIGDHGAAVFDDSSTDRKLTWQSQSIEWKEGQPVHHKAPAEPAMIAAEEPLRLECEAFLRSVQDRTPPLADLTSGLRVIAVLEACQESMRNGGASMTLDLPSLA